MYFADIFLDASHHHVFERTLAPDRHSSGKTIRVKQLEQGGEAIGVAVVRGGGKEEAVLEAPSEITNCTGELRLDAVAPAARRRSVMGLVQNQQATRQQLTQPLAHRIRVGRIDKQVV